MLVQIMYFYCDSLAKWMIQISAVTKSLWEYLQREIDSIP